jgi:hypothetical protein
VKQVRKITSKLFCYTANIRWLFKFITFQNINIIYEYIFKIVFRIRKEVVRLLDRAENLGNPIVLDCFLKQF